MDSISDSAHYKMLTSGLDFAHGLRTSFPSSKIIIYQIRIRLVVYQVKYMVIQLPGKTSSST